MTHPSFMMLFIAAAIAVSLQAMLQYLNETCREYWIKM